MLICLGTEMRLIFAHHSSIYKVDALGSSLEAITNTTAASGIDFHFERKLLFWTDTETRKVRHATRKACLALICGNSA